MHIETDIRAQYIRRFFIGVLIIASALLIGLLIGKGGFMTGAALLGLPFAVFGLAWFFNNAQVGLWASVLVGFFASGLARYIDAPWGLMMDIFLFISWLALAFSTKKVNWKGLNNNVFRITLIWYGLVVLEIINPESNGFLCWFYAMRGAGFYQLLLFGLVFILFDKAKYLDIFLKWMVILSLIGTAWGLRQMIFGVDAAEYRWLYVDGFAFTHMLAGVLRVFSFYSDAGQFGASQAMVALVCGLITFGDVPRKDKIFYGLAALVTFIGFAISGTRGALAVPAIGGIVYLVISRNFKILTLGFIVIGSVFYTLKYTFAFQGVEQVRRFRTALNPEDESFQVRLRNQKTFGRYLESRPLGGGIGAAGFWGARFNPYSLLANTATDSYYVKVWAETGIIGISLHLFMFGFFIGKGGVVVWNLRDPALRIKISGLYCGMCGVMMASYGNQVYSQMPTGIIMGIGIPLIFLAPQFDSE
jgi:hypothetical protein